jgi:hypothetical protein
MRFKQKEYIYGRQRLMPLALATVKCVKKFAQVRAALTPLSFRSGVAGMQKLKMACLQLLYVGQP